jgi:hypothetical protein
MDAFYHVWMVVTGHGYAAIVEFVIDMGDHVVTHLVAIIVIKSGVIVGWKTVKHVRTRKVAPKVAKRNVAKHVHAKVPHKVVHKTVVKATK